MKEIQQYLGLGSTQSVYHWLNGISMPTIDNLYALSELFKLPIDALVCGNRENIIPDIIVEFRVPHYTRMYCYYLNLREKCVA